MMRLSSRTRFVTIVKLIVKGVSYKEISAKLNGVSPGNINYIRRLALSDPKFKKIIKIEGIDTSAL